MRAHLDDEKRSGEQRCKKHRVAKRDGFGFLDLFATGSVGLGFSRDTSDTVASRLNGARQILFRGRSCKHFDCCTLGRKVDGGVSDTVNAFERLFDPSHAGGTGHALDIECNSLRGRWGIPGFTHRLGDLPDICRTRKFNSRTLGGEVDRSRSDARDGPNGFFNARYAGGASHPFDAKIEGLHAV